MKAALAKWVSVKVAAAAIGVALAGGGVALAASTGTEPTAALGKRDGANHGPAHPTGKPSTAPSKRDQPGAAPSPSLVGLCRAYAAGAGDNPGKALDNPAFSVLITAAGGKEKIAEFCAPALRDEPAAAPDAKPSKTPAAKPDNPAATRPTPKAKPSQHGKPRPSRVPATLDAP
jgi:hypothetical protein